MKYNIVYINQSKRLNTTLHATSHLEVVDLFNDLINGEIVEISELVHEDNFYPKDDGDYINAYKIQMTNKNNFYRSLKIPKIKKTINTESFKEHVFNHLLMNGKAEYMLKISKI